MLTGDKAAGVWGPVVQCVKSVPNYAAEIDASQKTVWISLYVHHYLPVQNPPAWTGVTERNTNNMPVNMSRHPAMGKSELRR